MKEQFINGMNDDDIIIMAIIYELIFLNDMSSVTSDQVLVWARKVKAHEDHNSILSSLKENKVSDVIRSYKPMPKLIQI